MLCFFCLPGLKTVDVLPLSEDDTWMYNMTRYDEPAVGELCSMRVVYVNVVIIDCLVVVVISFCAPKRSNKS